jgi:hypothetical protein
MSMSGMCLISYQEWSEYEGRVVRELQEKTVSNEEIFIRKLVNATMIRNQLYEHTSHEFEEGTRHIVYAKPYDERDLQIYGNHIKPALLEYCSSTVRVEAEFLYWNGAAFSRGTRLTLSTDPLEIAQLLLDHYLVIRGTTYENVYSILDTDRNKVLFYLREVNN